MRLLVCLIGMTSSIAAFVESTPTVAFPFNSQVPQVARKNQQYNFQLSESTFQPQNANFVYSLSQQPAWLSIDSATRTLAGTPSDSDVGAATFTITAADDSGAAHMACTLVVASDPAPQLQGNFAQQLSASVNLTSSDPAIVTLAPGTAFDFHFQQDAFIDIVQRKLYYYSTSTDHTPLPSWVNFDGSQLRFYGTAPQLSAFPQSFTVNLIASDYAGFAGAKATFTIVIAQQSLTVVPSEQTIQVSSGSRLDFTGLSSSVFQNGKKISPGDLKSATASLPGWLSFDAKTLDISGQAPDDFTSANGSIKLVDAQGDTAVVNLHFLGKTGSLWIGSIGDINATPGQDIDYTIPTSVIDDTDATLVLTVPQSADWISFDNRNRIIHGVAPTTASGVITATLAASAPGVTGIQSQVFAIDIGSTSSTRTQSSQSSSSSGSSNTDTAGAIQADITANHLSGGVIAAIVICSIIGVILLIALLLLCCCCIRRRRRQEGYVRQSPSPSKRSISGPKLLDPALDAITVTTQVHRDVEKTAGGEEDGHEDEDKAPQIAHEILPSPNLQSSKWAQRGSGMSQGSSLGNGEDAIRRNGDIPEWGQESDMMQKPHHSFSVPVEMARGGKKRRSTSPLKRTLSKIREKHSSQASHGLGIDIGAGGVPLSPSKKRSGRVRKKTSNLSAVDRSSVASGSTQATSLLSMRPSDFPRPPTQSGVRGSKVPALSVITDLDHANSIRMIGRSDSVEDTRPIQQKRQSFIRNRASTSIASPLFAHGSRIPSDAIKHGHHGSNSETGSSSMMSRGRSSKFGGSRSTYSQSSSQALSDRDSRNLQQRVRSAFAPNFPRVISRPDLEDDAIEDDFDENWEDVTPAVSARQSTADMQRLGDVTPSVPTSQSTADMQRIVADGNQPRHLRNWVLPGEASPTPPPAGIAAARRASSSRRSTPVSPSESGARLKWRERMNRSARSPSPLVASSSKPDDVAAAPELPKKSPKRRFSNLNEPIGLVSKDSLHRVHPERPRLGETKTSRPVSVEKVQRLSSLKAEADTDAGAGDEELDEFKGPEHVTGMDGSTTSHVSGKAFI